MEHSRNPDTSHHEQARREPSTSSLSSIASSHNSVSNAASPPQRTLSQSSLFNMASPHRQSFAENLRNLPPSPRSQRHPSFTGSLPTTVQDLLSFPQSQNPADSRFSGRDWRDVTIGELVSVGDVKWATMDTSVENATMVIPPSLLLSLFSVNA